MSHQPGMFRLHRLGFVVAAMGVSAMLRMCMDIAAKLREVSVRIMFGNRIAPSPPHDPWFISTLLTRVQRPAQIGVHPNICGRDGALRQPSAVRALSGPIEIL